MTGLPRAALPLATPFWSAAEIDAAMPAALGHLARDGVLAHPTETVYGFGGGIGPRALDALVALKGRAHKPFLLLIAGSDMLASLGVELGGPGAALAARHWPGPLTLVLRARVSNLDPRLRGPEGGVAVRWTSHAGLVRLIEAHGRPLTSTSANRPGVPPAMSAPEIVRDWGVAIGRGILLVLDGGQLESSAPSTVVDCTGSRVHVIRPGAISADLLRESVPDLIGNV